MMSEDIKTAVEGMATAFEEFKATNDARLAEIEKKGSSDPLVDEKLKNIEADLDRFEDINQKLTLAQQEQKGFSEKLENMEALLKRPEVSMETDQVDLAVKAFDKWLRKDKQGLEPEEIKALTVSDDTQAGFLAPPEYVNELIKTLTEISPMRTIGPSDQPEVGSDAISHRDLLCRLGSRTRDTVRDNGLHHSIGRDSDP